MKVVLINGSPRQHGNTSDVIKVCCEAIEAEGLEVKVIDLAGKKIESCVACYKCKKNPGYCALDDGLNEIIEEIRMAEGLIIASPVYFGTARGDVMSLMQRVGMVSKGCGDFLDGMVGGPIAIARRGGHTATIQEMLMFYFINGMIVCGSNYWNMVFALNPGDAEKDVDGIKTVKLFAHKVGDLIKKINY